MLNLSKGYVLTPFLASVLGLTANAQDPSGPQQKPFVRGAGGIGIDPIRVPVVTLLKYSIVHEELGLSESQKARIREVERGREEAMNQLLHGRPTSLQTLEQLSRKDVITYRQYLISERERVWKKSETDLLNILTINQKRRVYQIQLQAEGPLAFGRQDVQNRLGLDEEQILIINEIIEAGIAEMLKSSNTKMLDENGRTLLTQERYRILSEDKKFQKKIETNLALTKNTRNLTLRLIISNLSKRQKLLYKNMTGAPFDLSKLRDKT